MVDGGWWVDGSDVIKKADQLIELGLDNIRHHILTIYIMIHSKITI